MSEKLDYKIVRNLDENLVRQILGFSKNDIEIRRNTTDFVEGKGRFANTENFEKWLKKERSMFLFLDGNGDLLGLIWFGKEISQVSGLEDYNSTFAIRLYEKARGKKLAQKFIEQSVGQYLQENTNAKIWLSSEEKNYIANNLYRKIFKFVGNMENRNYYIIN